MLKRREGRVSGGKEYQVRGERAAQRLCDVMWSTRISVAEIRTATRHFLAPKRLLGSIMTTAKGTEAVYSDW